MKKVLLITFIAISFIGCGNKDKQVQSKPKSDDVIIKFKDEAGNNNFLSAVASDVTDNKILEGCDSLTKIPNRGFFLEKLNFLIRLNKIQNRKGAVIYIDIDNFKTLNDNFGHHFGDMVLKLFSQLLLCYP